MNLDALNLDWQALAQGSVRVLVILVLWWGLIRLARLLLSRLHQKLLRDSEGGPSMIEDHKRADTLVKLVRQTVQIVITLTLGMVLLMQLGVEVGPIIASAGVLGLAIGFGAQSLVKDIITGFFFVFENQLRVGDVVQINGTGGLVEAMTLRTIVLRDQSGTVHVFPNGAVNTLSNMTRGWSAYVFDIGVAYRTDPDLAIAVIRDTAEQLRADPRFGPLILEAPEIFGVDKLADSAVIIRGRIKTQPIKQWEVGREFLRRVKKALDAANIEIPFPQRTISMAADSPPAPAALALLNSANAGQAKEDAGDA